MKTNIYSKKTARGAFALICVIVSVLTLSSLQSAAGVIPVNAKAHGKSYGEWSAAWWQWNMEHPLEGHPSIDDPSFDVTSGQTGKVWFLGFPFGLGVERQITIPTGTTLFISLLNAEASDLEGLGNTPEERLENASFLANHIRNLSVTIDGASVKNLHRFRVVSPEFTFTAPTPWIFGETGGEGTSVGDGYFLLLTPFSAGTHTIHIGGDFHFSTAEGDPFDLDLVADMTYIITVQ